MRLIDGDKLKQDIDMMCDGFDGIKMLVDEAPTIDAVQVVRCRNCKHFMEYTNQHRFESAFDGDCRLLAGYTDCDREKRRYMDYCSDGVKMDAEVEGC